MSIPHNNLLTIFTLLTSVLTGLLFSLYIGMIVLFLSQILGTILLSVGELKNTEYRIYPNHVESQDSFINRQNQSLKYKDVTDIQVKRPLLQRLFGCGTIMLSTAGKGGSGLKLYYVENPDFVYEELSDIVSNEDFERSRYR